jgi:hypothetical protein
MVVNFCVSTHYDPLTSTTHCFIHGLDPWEQEAFACRLKQFSSTPTSLIPTLVPALLLEFIQIAAQGTQGDVQDTIFRVESHTGLGPQWWVSALRPKDSEGDAVRKRLDEMQFTEIIHDITGASTKTAYINYRCKSYFPILDTLDEIGRDCATNAASEQREAADAAERSMRIFVSRLRILLQGIQARAEYHAARLRIQRETVRPL